MKFNNDRAIFLNKTITIEDSGRFVQQIIGLNKKSESDPIFIVINSVGGNIRGLQTMISAIEMLKDKNEIITINIGLAASCAGILFLQGSKRLALQGSELVFHEPNGELNGKYKYSEIVKAMKECKIYYDYFVEKIVSTTNLSKNCITKRIYGKDYVLSATEALKIRAATKIITNIDNEV